MSDFLRGDLKRKYAPLMKYVKVTLLQVGLTWAGRSHFCMCAQGRRPPPALGKSWPSRARLNWPVFAPAVTHSGSLHFSMPFMWQYAPSIVLAKIHTSRVHALCRAWTASWRSLVQPLSRLQKLCCRVCCCAPVAPMVCTQSMDRILAQFAEALQPLPVTTSQTGV